MSDLVEWIALGSAALVCLVLLIGLFWGLERLLKWLGEQK